MRLASAFLVIFFAITVGQAHAASKTFSWDAPRMSDGTLIPTAAGIVYKLYYGPTSRGTAQRDTFTYPNVLPPVATTTVSVSIPDGTSACASVTAVAPAEYRWTVGTTQYAIAAQESVYSNEVCLDIPIPAIPIPAPANFRVVP